MPGRNGYEVARFIKQSPSLAHIPVVLLTGAFEPVDQARASDAGCDGVLAKPFEPQLVIGRVKDLLARRSAAAAASGTLAPIPTSAPSVPAPGQSPAISLDSYFDRLDAAFTNVSAAPAATSGRPPLAPAAPSMADEIDWFGAAKAETPAPPPELELPTPPAMDERPDLPLSAFATTVSEPETAPGATVIAPEEHYAPPSPIAETAYVPIPATAASPAPVAEPPSSVAEVPAPAAH